jgi:hypothetical protein
VHRFIADGDLDVVGLGAHRAKLVDRRQVLELRERLRLGLAGRRARTVIMVDAPEFDLQVVSLRAAGLHVELAATVLEAAAMHETPGMPVFIVPTTLEDTELNLLRTYAQRANVIFLGDARELDDTWYTIGSVSFVPLDEVKGLVALCWRLVSSRFGEAALKF